MAFEKVTREQDYSKWYNNLVENADLAQHSSVRGCMVIKPYGYAIWEKMQAELDRRFKETGHENAYFPLFVPKSLFEAEEARSVGSSGVNLFRGPDLGALDRSVAPTLRSAPFDCAEAPRDSPPPVRSCP